jgi:uncharacterized OsmC-like protein
VKIEARLINSGNDHQVMVSTNNNAKAIRISAKAEGTGSSVNGGELLFTALATCVCNDIYREAARRNIVISLIDVKVTGEFGGEGEPAKKISYHVKIDSPNHHHEIQKLIADVDGVAEIHKTLRQGIDVKLDI